MPDAQLKDKIHKALRAANIGDAVDLVDVNDGPDDSIHFVVVSRKYDERRMQEKNDLIWGVLTDQFTP